MGSCDNVNADNLNDLLDACCDRETQRSTFKTFPKEHQADVIAEHIRRTEDRVAPIGSLVEPLNISRGIQIALRLHNSVTYAYYHNLATVVGQKEHGNRVRYLWLHVPWENKEMTIVFGEASSIDLRVCE